MPQLRLVDLLAAGAQRQPDGIVVGVAAALARPQAGDVELGELGGERAQAVVGEPRGQSRSAPERSCTTSTSPEPWTVSAISPLRKCSCPTATSSALDGSSSSRGAAGIC